MDQIILIIFLTFFSAVIGTITGFGISTIMVPIMAFILPIPETLLFVGIIHWFSDIWKIIFFKKGVNLKLIFLFGVPGVLVSFFAAQIPFLFSANFLKQLLGVFLILYSVILMIKPKWKLKANNNNAIIGGSLTGFVSAVFGSGGAIRSTFLTAYNLKKEVFIFTSGVIAFFIDSTRIIQYLTQTSLNPLWLKYLVVCIPFTFLGAFIAKKYVNVMPQELFRKVILIALFIFGIRYLIFGELYL